MLYSFQGSPDAATPTGGVVFDKAGNLYGAALGGPQGSQGTVFQLMPPAKKGGLWAESVLYVFQGKPVNDGQTPTSGLVIDGVGNLYGVTGYGGNGGCILLGILSGCGTVYEMSPPTENGGKWKETIIYSFQGGKDGYLPMGNLTFDKAGNLYGATYFGGGKGTTCNPYYQYCGTVFKLSPPKTKSGKWKEKVLYSFNSGRDGANPNGGLVFDSRGTIYGTTYGGGNESGECGAGGCGTAFELNPPTQKGGAWTATVLHRFNRNTSDNGLPSAGFAMDGKGYLYGSTVGTVFRLSPPSTKSGRWRETILYSFNQDAYGPQGALIFDPSGNLYGTTYSSDIFRGTTFKLKPPGRKGGAWTLRILYGFTGSPDGAQPAANLVFDEHGDLYSTTTQGGAGTGCSFHGCGTVFEVLP